MRMNLPIRRGNIRVYVREKMSLKAKCYVDMSGRSCVNVLAGLLDVITARYVYMQ